MSIKTKGRAALREIPSVEEIILYYNDLLINAPYLLYLSKIRNTLDEIRNNILKGNVISDVNEFYVILTCFN